MTWRAVHPSITEERTVPADDPNAPTFTIGFWPPLECEKARIYIGKLRQPTKEGEVPSEAEQLKRAHADLAAFWAMVRFGVRDWSGLGELECKTETVKIDGREHVALTDESVQVLYASGLLLPVALECWKYNNLSEEEKKTSSSQSISSAFPNPTPATGAIHSSSRDRNVAVSYG